MGVAPDMVRAADRSGAEPEPAAPREFGFARPKSMSLVPDLVSMMLPGLKSRCTMPARWAISKASATSIPIFSEFRERQRAPAQAVGKRLAVEELHDQEVGAVLRADVVEMADVRMIQRGNGAGFALETLLEFGIGGEMSGENLDGNGAIEARVFRAVDLAHAAGAERGLNFVGTEFCARG